MIRWRRILAIKDAELQGTEVDKAYVQYEQEKKRDQDMEQFMQKQAQDRENFWNQMLMKEMQDKQQAEAAQAQQAQQGAEPPSGPPAPAGPPQPMT